MISTYGEELFLNLKHSSAAYYGSQHPDIFDFTRINGKGICR